MGGSCPSERSRPKGVVMRQRVTPKRDAALQRLHCHHTSRILHYHRRARSTKPANFVTICTS